MALDERPSTSPSPSPGSSSKRPAPTTSPDDDTEQSKRERPKFKRSKNGCLTCRRRRKRCDLAPGPECKTCQRLKLTCRWPESNGTPQRSMRATPRPDLSSSSHPSQPPQSHHTGDPLDLLASALGMHEAPSQAGPSSVSASSTGPPPRMSDVPVPGSQVDLLQSFPFGDILGNFELDAATLHLWAADCLQPQQNGGAAPMDLFFRSESSLPPSDLVPPPAPQTSANVSSEPVLSPASASALRNGPRHADLLHHFQNSLSRLVTCSGESGGWSAFTDLADRSTSLYLSILAWAGRHMANSGHVRYEAISERLGAEAGVMVLSELEKVAQPGSAGAIDDEDAMTLLATGLMVIQFRICRGDVWGFDLLVERTGTLASYLFERVDSAHNVRAAQFLDNLIYHDVLSSFAYTRGPMIPYSLILKHSQGQLSALHTLTGVNLPVFCKMYRVIKLIQERRAASSETGGNSALLQVLGAAEQLEDELEAERLRVEDLVRAQPDLGVHRYYHEAFRTATLIQIRGFVLCESPCSLKLRLLVRQGLALLETMVERNLAGTCSVHWVLFIIGVMALPGAPGEESNDRDRVDKLYKDYSKNYGGFLNVPRTKTLVHEVWARNQEGRAFVDWLDIVLEYDWELYFV